MSGNRKYWKLWAKGFLQGKWSTAIMGMLAAPLMNTIGIMAAGWLFPGMDFLSWILGEAFLMIVSLLSMIVSTGYNYMLLNMARGRSYGFGDLFCMFRKGSDGVLTAGLVMALIDTVVMIPFYYLVNMTSPAAETLAAQVQWMKPVMAAMLIGTLLGVLMKLPFSMAFYLLADNPQMKGMQALKQSAGLMKGHIVSFFVLQLSFVPLMILSLFTFYIGLLWIMPYMYASLTVFYMDVTGELEQKKRNHTQEVIGWMSGEGWNPKTEPGPELREIEEEQPAEIPYEIGENQPEEKPSIGDDDDAEA